MKIKLFALTFFYSLLALNVHSQFLQDGKYTYENEGLFLQLEICDEGVSVCSLILSEGPDEILADSKGSWFAVNMNGAGENYTGPSGWYQVSANNTTFEISSLSGDSISLSGYGTSEIKLSMVKDSPITYFVGEFKNASCSDAACPCGACYYIFQDPLGKEITFQQYDEAALGITLIMYTDEVQPIANSELTGKMFSITYVKVPCSCIDPISGESITTEELKIVSIQAK